MGSKKRIKIMPQVIDTTQRRITLNVGGQKHETYLSTIRNYPDTRLYWVVENVTKTVDYHSEKIELFFDRHPGIFALVLNYYRTGKLHCPNDVCGPLFEEELAYWGIDEKDMEPCCWTTYIQHRDAENNLKSFNVAEFETEAEEDGDIKQKESGMECKSSIFCTMWTTYKPKIWQILEEPRSSKAAKAFSIISVILIVLSVGALCAMTLPDLSESASKDHKSATRIIFEVIEYVCGLWFTVELLGRIAFCPNKRKFFKSFSFWIDLFAVIPFFIRLLYPGGGTLADAMSVIRLLRLFRFFRLLYGLQVLLHTLKASSYELFLLLIILLIPVILFSSVIFYVEKYFNPLSSDFRSIPDSFWWSLITMTTVGYGDVTPDSWAGKVIGGACAIFGVLMVALPISVIGSNFNLYYAHAQARLKLPKKKNRFHFDSITTGMSRDALRRRGLRKRNTRWSDGEDGTSLCSGRANSAVKTELRSWSIASSGRSAFDLVNEDRNSSAKAYSKRKISRERRISRNERSPKLDDLPEHENETEGFHGDSNSIESPNNGFKNHIGNHDASNRMRSYSMPLNASKDQIHRLPSKSRSDSSNLCERCSLPKDDRIDRIDNGDIPTLASSCDLCRCQDLEYKRYHRQSSSFTIVIPCIEGTEDWIEVSTENIRGRFPRSKSFNCDGFGTTRSTNHSNFSNGEFSQHNNNSLLRCIGTDSDEEFHDLHDRSPVPLLMVKPTNSNKSSKNSIEMETSI